MRPRIRRNPSSHSRLRRAIKFSALYKLVESLHNHGETDHCEMRCAHVTSLKLRRSTSWLCPTSTFVGISLGKSEAQKRSSSFWLASNTHAISPQRGRYRERETEVNALTKPCLPQ